jgi:hypothetical protein
MSRPIGLESHGHAAKSPLIGFSLVFALILSLTLPLFASDFATVVLDYVPGADAEFTDSSAAIGAPSTMATPFVPDNEVIVSLGQTGYIVLGFDHPIVHYDLNPGGYDFIVFGNAFYVGSIFYHFQEPGIVEVGVNTGSGYNEATPFYKLQGSLNPQSSANPPSPKFTSIDERNSLTWGYADVTPVDGTGNPLIPDDPFSSGITPGSAGGDAFKLSWAVDSNGNPVILDHVDYVRIRPAGQWSPDVDAVSILKPLPVEFTGTVKLKGWMGSDISSVPVTLVIDGGEPSIIYLTGTGNTGTFVTQLPNSGSLAVQIKFGCYLSQTLTIPTSGTPVFGTFDGSDHSGLIPGDTNNDNKIDDLDFLAVIGNFGKISSIGDCNGDGIVNDLDFLNIIASFGSVGN